jgi:hypothetical protein
MSDTDSRNQHDVVEMYESGMAWEDIARELDVRVDVALARYREQAYNHWNTGWEMKADDGQARFTSGAVDVWSDGETTIHIEEIAGNIPLTIVVDDDSTRTLTDASITADEARELAETLDECADILEDQYGRE